MIVALVVAIGSILIALTTAVYVPRQAAKIASDAKQADWDHQAKVAAEKAAVDAAVAAAVNNKLDESIKQGKATHALSNQAYTEALEGIYDATDMAISSWEEMAAMRKALGQKPLASNTAKIKQGKAKLDELKKQMEERREIGEQVVAAVNGL